MASQVCPPGPTAYRRSFLERYLTCTICLEPYKMNIEALPCKHIFCLGCLEGQHNKWLEDCRRTPDQEPFGCSICQTPATLPSKGVAGLPDNHLVANLCEEFSKKTQVGGQKNRCVFHSKKDVGLFCQQCEIPVCGECTVNTHSGHTFAGVQQVAPQMKANIRAKLNNSLHKMKAFSAFLNKIVDAQKRLTDNRTQVQQEIYKAYEVQEKKLQEQEKRRELQEQRNGLLATLEKQQQDNMAALAGQRNIVLTQLAELSRVCEGAEKIVKQEMPVWITQDLNLAQQIAEFKLSTQIPEICETRLYHFEPHKSDTLMELGKVTSQSMSAKQLVQSSDTNTGEAKSTDHVKPPRVGNSWVRKVKFGEWGSHRGEFKCSSGVAVSLDNEVYIADCENFRIQVFTMDGVYLKKFATILPRKTGKKLRPHDVAVDRNDNLWVVSKDHIVQYSREGKGLAQIDLPYVDNTRGITVATEQVIVTECDGQNGCLRLFNRDGSEVNIYCSPLFGFPQCVTVDGEGNILVTDNRNHCVHVLDRDGNFKFKFGSEGSGESQLKYPRGICVDGMGNIIVADSGNGCVKMFDSQRRFLCHIASERELQLAPNDDNDNNTATGTKWPYGVAVSPGGDVVVTEYYTASVWTLG
uniref:RING-type E3 ubiquitin transferase n=1 Tax=Branchiostoma floridae TaxID=7739 RepID=C3Y801_BRAFL|eukprot:XP_002607646.1 hypothetical protein BRAFLDRAFT_84665 [Branchiostoma floridae]